MASAPTAQPSEAEATFQSGSSAAQQEWATRPIVARLKILRQARHILASMSNELAEAIPPTLARNPADTRAAEILPLLAACRFLETDATRILAARKLGSKGRPFWLAGVHSEIHRIPFGTVLIISPSNYPLLLAGVQALQALAAGNAVVWKPGTGGRPVADVFARVLERAGLPEHLLRVTDDTVATAQVELARRPAKIFFTGSSSVGKQILHTAAETTTPVVAELSGNDAVLVLPSADTNRVLEALTFGMRLNGSATCMAPRRLILVGTGHQPLIASLRERFASMPGVALPSQTRKQLAELVRDAEAHGAKVLGDPDALRIQPILILNGDPRIAAAQSDIFAPILTVIEVADTDAAIAAEQACPYGLTTAIFGRESEARALIPRLDSGSIFINDLIVPTADPRISFTGRRASGFGPTRGTEGLLEMTFPQTVLARRSRNLLHYQETTAAHISLFDGIIQASHSATFRERLHGLRRLISAARNLK